MGVSVKVEPIERDIEVFLADDLSPAGRSQALAEFARAALADADATNLAATGAPVAHETIVDGRRGASIETVKPDGTIVFEFDILEDLFAWIGEQLLQHSPVRSGAYARAHVFVADGTVIEPGAPVPPASEYVFLNSEPYARKIERGESPQAPDGVYEGVAALARARFGNVAAIKFSYRAPLFGGVDAWAGKTMLGSRMRSARTRSDWLRRQPAIVITVR